jgi:hypothetical protein
LNGIGTSAQLNYPTDIALDSNGFMGYIVEQKGHRIRSVVLSNASVSSLAGSGASGFRDSSGTAAQFDGPTSAVWHPSGTLYVAEGVNQRIRSVSTATAAVATLAGSGAAGGSNGVGTAATFNRPRGVALDEAGV